MDSKKALPEKKGNRGEKISKVKGEAKQINNKAGEINDVIKKQDKDMDRMNRNLHNTRNLLREMNDDFDDLEKKKKKKFCALI